MGVDERIMVVPREAVVGPLGYYVAIPITPEALHREVLAHAYPYPRRAAEEDERLLQIIPYIALRIGENGLIGARRLSGGNEQRLHDGFTLGFGGHVRWNDGEDDVDPYRLVDRSVRHEMHEELGITNASVREFTHILLDDTNPVGRVHLGLLGSLDLLSVMTAEEARRLQSAEPDKLQLFGISEAFQQDHFDKLEGWGKLALRTLRADAFSR